MDTSSVIVTFAIFALIIIAAFAVYPQRVKAILKGFGFKLDIDASNNTSSNQAIIIGEDIKSHKGGLVAEDRTGRGIEVKKIEVQDDVLLISSVDLSEEAPKDNLLT